MKFLFNGKEISARFIRHEERVRERPKKEMVLEVLKNAERAMTVNEILEEINRKYRAYRIESRRDFYNATTSLTKACLLYTSPSPRDRG